MKTSKILSNSEIIAAINDESGAIGTITERIGVHRPRVYFATVAHTIDYDDIITNSPYVTSLAQIVPIWEQNVGEDFSKCTNISAVIDFAVERYLISLKGKSVGLYYPGGLGQNAIARVNALIFLAPNDWIDSSHNKAGRPIYSDAYFCNYENQLPSSVNKHQTVYFDADFDLQEITASDLARVFDNKVSVNDSYN